MRAAAESIPITGATADTSPVDEWREPDPGTFEYEAGHVAYWMVQEALDKYPEAPVWLQSRLTPKEWRSQLAGIVTDIYGLERKRHVEDRAVALLGDPTPMRPRASVTHMRQAFEAVIRAIGGLA